MDPIWLHGSHANAANHPYHRVGLSLALTLAKIPNLKIPGSHNHRGNVSNLKLLSTDLDPALRFDLLS
jgi:hypothetical protein